MRLLPTVSLLALLVTGCGTAQEAPSNNAAAPAVSNAVATPANAAVAAATPPPAAPSTLTLNGQGLEPGIRFGMPQEAAIAAAAAVLGTPTSRDHNDECGEGPMDFASFNDLQLAFQDGRLVGWALGGARPAWRTAGGLAIGAPRSALGDAEIDQESSLGPEFAVDGVGGILDQAGTRIEALWAGDTCQFR